jgi:predicted secreted protein
MPAASAGRDQICFAAMGIPCVGSMALDVQAELFPMLCIKDVYDVAEIRKLVNKVLDDDALYRHVQKYAHEKVQKYGIPDAQYQAKLIKQAMGWEA